MKYLLTFLIALTIYSCSEQSTISENEIRGQLKEVEKILYSNPKAVLDSLSGKIGKKSVIDEFSALSIIYYTIAYEQSYGAVKGDSLLSLAYEWFTKKKDYLNICRSLLYKSIYYTAKDKQDSSAYKMLKDAESLLQIKKIDNPQLEASLYLYLGKINRAKGDGPQALEYLSKSKEISAHNNYKTGVLNSSLELFNYYIGIREYGDALNSIACFGDENQLAPYIEYDYYSGMYLYYVSKKDYAIAIEFLKKILNLKNSSEVEINYPKIYYQLALQFKRLDMKDSTLEYGILSVKSIKDSASTDSHFYYRNLAEIYAASGDYKTALDYYKRAHNSYVNAYTRQSIARLTEVNRKYDINLKNRQIESLKNDKALFINLMVLLIFILIISTILFVVKFISLKRDKTEVLRKSDELNKEQRKLWLISEIGRSNSDILPQVIDNVYLEAARSRKVSNEIFDSLNNVIDQANTLSRSSLSAITNDSNFENYYGNIEKLKQLTYFEKLVYILSE